MSAASSLAMTEVEALEVANNRLRAVLNTIRDMAGLMGQAALDNHEETASRGLIYLGRLASDALEEA
jgi:hypothetical protein